MHVIIFAHHVKFEVGDGYTAKSHMLFSDDISKEVVEVQNRAELEAALDRVFEATKVAQPGHTFEVGATRHPRSAGRAFAGYNKGRWRREQAEGVYARDN
jgi:hypothetical protein